MENVRITFARILASDASEEVKKMAEKLDAVEETRAVTVQANLHNPDDALPVDDEWQDLFDEVTAEGREAAASMHVTICGMARNIAGIIPVTMARLGTLCESFADFGMVFVENDSRDETKKLLKHVESSNPGRVIAICEDYNWPHLHGWEPERVQRYAMLRNKYRDAAMQHFRGTDMILAVDLDCWGGWSIDGLLNGIGWMKRKHNAACMASTSLFQGVSLDGQCGFAHYDTWALRVHGWKHELAPWKTMWLPPPGSPPIELYSAFGAAAWYRPEAFWENEYASIDGDIEHAGLHRSMIGNGWSIYLNPSQRSLMTWKVPE